MKVTNIAENVLIISLIIAVNVYLNNVLCCTVLVLVNINPVMEMLIFKINIIKRLNYLSIYLSINFIYHIYLFEFNLI